MKKLCAVMCAVLLMLGMAVNMEAQPAGGNDFSTSVNPRGTLPRWMPTTLS